MKPDAILRFAATLVCAGVLHISAAGAVTEAVVYAFKGGSDGHGPVAGLIDVEGTLYGTTAYGGSSKRCRDGCGTEFSLTPSGTHTVIHRFGKEAGDGKFPGGSLISVNGTLYGTTVGGGIRGCFKARGCGSVFSITLNGAEAVLYAFRGGSDGSGPQAGLIDVKGTFYGTTLYDGAHGGGTVFSITPGGTETVLHAFQGGSDGSATYARLINVNGALYGTTFEGGGTSCHAPYGCGTVFSITPSGTEKVVYAFKGGSDGEGPSAGLINIKGTLYGTTIYGGDMSCHAPYGCGTVFSVARRGTETVLYAFHYGADGAFPSARLLNSNGTLYGTTLSGGGTSCGCGTVFSLTPSGTESVLHSFGGGSDGAQPEGDLISIKGILYGTTYSGGASNGGTVFSIVP